WSGRSIGCSRRSRSCSARRIRRSAPRIPRRAMPATPGAPHNPPKVSHATRSSARGRMAALSRAGMTATLHYIYDPLCGWCYGAQPLVWSAAKASGVELELHGGALWPEPTQLPESTRLYIRQADQRIAQMSGQRFGPDYHNGLLLDPTMVLESRPPTAAVPPAGSIGRAETPPMRPRRHHGPLQA